MYEMFLVVFTFGLFMLALLTFILKLIDRTPKQKR